MAGVLSSLATLSCQRIIDSEPRRQTLSLAACAHDPRLSCMFHAQASPPLGLKMPAGAPWGMGPSSLDGARAKVGVCSFVVCAQNEVGLEPWMLNFKPLASATKHTSLSRRRGHLASKKAGRLPEARAYAWWPMQAVRTWRSRLKADLVLGPLKHEQRSGRGTSSALLPGEGARV